MSDPKQGGRDWLRQQTRLGRRGARPAIVAGLASTLLAVAQTLCAAAMLGSALSGRAFAAGTALAGFAVAALLRAALMVEADRMAVRAGIVARRRIRGD